MSYIEMKNFYSFLFMKAWKSLAYAQVSSTKRAFICKDSQLQLLEGSSTQEKPKVIKDVNSLLYVVLI